MFEAQQLWTRLWWHTKFRLAMPQSLLGCREDAHVSFREAFQGNPSHKLITMLSWIADIVRTERRTKYHG